MSKTVFFSILFFAVANAALSQANQKFELTEHDDLLYLDREAVENDSLQRLHLVLPKTDESFPLFIWIGGGAWAYGDRRQEMDLARRFGEKGIAVASIGHRLSPAIWRDSSLNTGIQHPEHIEDVASAVKWL